MHTNNKTIIKIYAISTTTENGLAGQSIVPAQNISINDTNNNPDILPNHHLILQLLECDGNPTNALKHAVGIITENMSNNKNENVIICPIIMGPPWSSFAIRTSPVLGAYNYGQISSSATSIVLSDNNLYPFSYRTVPSDALQGKALVELAKEFEWTKLGVIYFDDNYGINLSKVIVDTALKYDIKVLKTHYTLNDDTSFESVANFVKENKLYITIIISKAKDVSEMLKYFDNIGILGYPYYYIGVDSWFDSSDITRAGLQDRTKYFIG